MGSLFERIADWIKEGLIEAITGQYTGIFDSVNSQVADVAGQVGQTPQGWNGGVFSMIQNLSETVVIPIAGMILTFVLVYELIQMILEKNNMHDFDTFNIFKWIFKTFVATYLLTNCFTIVMAVFDVAQNVVSQSAGVINGSLDVEAALALLAVGGVGYYVKIVRPKQLAEDDDGFDDDGYGEGFDPDEAFGEPEYLSEDDFDDRMDDNEPEDGE